MCVRGDGFCFFFFQAEDGIRDIGVTGVQTCALPIFRHAASVHPEPGSNSPSEIVNAHAPGGPWGVLEGARWPWSHSSLTIRPGRTGGMGGTGANPCTARGSSVIRMRQGTVPREASPPRDGVLALAFRTLLSFQGTSPGCSSATHLRFPR